jgi:single stranded DNA-binding protein
MNIVVISGNMGKDPEVRSFGERSKWSTSVAVSKRVKKGDEWVEQTTWVNVAVWGSSAQMVMLSDLHKGSAVVVQGELSITKSDDGKCWTEVVAQVDGVAIGRERVAKSGRGRDEDTPFLCCLDTRRLARS